MIKEAIVKIVDKQDLTYDEAYDVMREIMNGETTPTQNAAYLAALSTKSTKAETIAEIAGSAAAMRDGAIQFDNPYETLDIVGTGGDGSHSFNISSTSALVIAACTLPSVFSSLPCMMESTTNFRVADLGLSNTTLIFFI
jgi:anthranilate phosphoribosyltransferase